MARYLKLGTATALLAVTAYVVYFVVVTPHDHGDRRPGVRIGGELTDPPDDWNSIDHNRLISLKPGGFPPFVVNVVFATDEGGIVTGSIPDGGYWENRVRDGTDGWIRVGDTTFAMRSREILGDARIPYLRLFHDKNNGTEGDEALTGDYGTWEIFYWTPR